MLTQVYNSLSLYLLTGGLSSLTRTSRNQKGLNTKDTMVSKEDLKTFVYIVSSQSALA